jgi:hypothetical protein
MTKSQHCAGLYSTRKGGDQSIDALFDCLDFFEVESVFPGLTDEVLDTMSNEGMTDGPIFIVHSRLTLLQALCGDRG